MKNIEALIADGGEITLGRLYPIKCAATAADGHNSVAMLARREGETLTKLLKRLDKAIGRYVDDDEFIDEINGDSQQLGVKTGWLEAYAALAGALKSHG